MAKGQRKGAGQQADHGAELEHRLAGPRRQVVIGSLEGACWLQVCLVPRPKWLLLDRAVQICLFCR